MNATRAATIRLRSSFDGAVSLGRVQTPTLAIVARREEEIRAFKPEPYWLVDATFAADAAGGREGGERVYVGTSRRAGGRAGSGSTKGPRIGTEAGGAGDRGRLRGQAGRRSPSSRRKSSARKRRCSTT